MLWFVCVSACVCVVGGGGCLFLVGCLFVIDFCLGVVCWLVGWLFLLMFIVVVARFVLVFIWGGGGGREGRECVYR